MNRGELMLRAILAAEAGQQATALGHIDALCLDVERAAAAAERERVLAALEVEFCRPPFWTYNGNDIVGVDDLKDFITRLRAEGGDRD